MIDRCRETIVRGLAQGRPGVAVVAGALNMSVRTFQRRLAEAGWTYKELLDDVRFAEARRAMARPDELLKVVAIDVGFEEQASFTRAFRRWTGLSPRDYRLRLDVAERESAQPVADRRFARISAEIEASIAGFDRP